MLLNNKKATMIFRRLVLLLVISLAVLAADIFALVFAYKKASAAIRDIQPFESLAFAEGNNGTAAYIDVTEEPVYASGVKNSKKKTYNYYLLSDGKNTYAALMSTIRAKDINKALNESGKMHIVGCTEPLSEKTHKKLEALFPDTLSKGVVKEIYIPFNADTYHLLQSPYYHLSLMLAILLTAFIMVVISLSYAVTFAAIDTDGIERAEIEAEMNAPDAVWLDEMKCYACKNRIVGMGKGIKSVKYTDAAMIFRRRTGNINGVKVLDELCAADKYGKLYVLSAFSRRKRADAEMERLKQIALNANPDIYFGLDKNRLKELQKYGRG